VAIKDSVNAVTEESSLLVSKTSDKERSSRVAAQLVEEASDETAVTSSPRRVTFSSITVPMNGGGNDGQRQQLISTVSTSLRVDSNREPEAEASLVEDLIRAASRNSSRPASRAASAAESRPESRAESRAGSRAGKTARKAFGVDPDSIEEPDRDSPVLTPRARRLEKERRVASLGLSPPKHLHTTQEVSGQCKIENRSAVTSGMTGDKYIVTSLQRFDQIAVKKSKQEKVSKLLARQKRKAERLARKKYRGFGQPTPAAAVEGDKVSVKKEEEKLEKREQMRKLKLSAARHSHLTQEESDLIASLLLDAETAVLQSNLVAAEEPQKTAVPVPVSATQNLILDFEESHTLSESQAHTDEQDFLCGL
jgi:hypothetical protein